MIRNVGLGISGTPVVIVGLAGLKQGCIAFVAIAEASAAGALAAAVVIGNDVVLAVTRVVTGADPGDGRHVRTRRARRLRSAATPAQKPVDCAMPPIVARRGVARIRVGRAACRLSFCATCVGRAPGRKLPKTHPTIAWTFLIGRRRPGGSSLYFAPRLQNNLES